MNVAERVRIITLPKNTVQDTISRHNDYRRTGRPKPQTSTERKSIQLTSKRNKTLTVQEIMAEFNRGHLNNIFLSTV